MGTHFILEISCNQGSATTIPHQQCDLRENPGSVLPAAKPRDQRSIPLSPSTYRYSRQHSGRPVGGLCMLQVLGRHDMLSIKCRGLSAGYHSPRVLPYRSTEWRESCHQSPSSRKLGNVQALALRGSHEHRWRNRNHEYGDYVYSHSSVDNTTTAQGEHHVRCSRPAGSRSASASVEVTKEDLVSKMW